MKRWPIIVGLLSYLIFCVAAWEIYRDRIGEKLGQSATEALAEAVGSEPAADGAEIAYDGMRGTLKGIADAEVAERVRDEIERSVGVGTLGIELANKKEVHRLPEIIAENPDPPAAKAERPTFAMRPGAKTGTFVMEGILPSDDLIDALVLGTRDECDAVRWVDAENLRSAAVEDAEWVGKLPALVTLLASNVDRATLHVDGEKMVISGNAKGDEGREEVLTLGEKMAGDLLELEDAILVGKPPVLIVLKIGDQISVQGLLPNEGLAGQLVAAIETKFMLAPAVERVELKMDGGGKMPAWFPRVVAAIPDLLAEVNPGRVEISNAGLVVIAGVRSADSREKVLARLAEIAGGEMPVRDTEVVVLKPPKLAVVLAGEKVTVSGRLPTAEHRAFVENSIRGFLSTVEIENGIVVDENVWDPAWLPPAGDAIPEFLQFASALGEAKIDIDGETLFASAKLTSDELKKPAELLFSPLGRAGVKLNLDFEVFLQPRLLLSHFGGKSKVGGRLAGIETKQKFLNITASAFPDAEVEDAVVLDKNVAESGWDTMVLDLVSDVFEAVDEPGIDFRPGKVRIEGEVGSERVRVALEKRLYEEYGAAFDIENAIRIPEEMVAEPKFELAEEEGKWALFGMVSSAEEKAAIFKAVETVRSREELVDHLEVAEDVGASPWIGEIGPVIAAVAGAENLWVQVFQGTLTVEGDFRDADSKNRLGDAFGKMKGLKFEDWTKVRTVAPGVVVPPPPGLEIEKEIEGN